MPTETLFPHRREGRGDPSVIRDLALQLVVQEKVEAILSSLTSLPPPPPPPPPTPPSASSSIYDSTPFACTARALPCASEVPQRPRGRVSLQGRRNCALKHQTLTHLPFPQGSSFTSHPSPEAQNGTPCCTSFATRSPAHDDREAEETEHCRRGDWESGTKGLGDGSDRAFST